MERLGTNLNEIDTTDCENSLESLQVRYLECFPKCFTVTSLWIFLQQIAVKLYEKDPSKLTSVDEPLPTVSTSSDLSDEEDSNLDAGPGPATARPDIKEEPVEVQEVGVAPNMTAGPGPPPGARQFPGHHLDRQSFSSVSGPEEPGTDSETVRRHQLCS